MAPVSPTARNRPSLLIERHVAALILSLLVQVFWTGESLQVVREFVGVEGENPMADSRRDAPVLFRESFAVFIGVDGAVMAAGITGIAVGWALKKR